MSRIVAVPCGAGLGPTGTLIACYLVRSGLTSDEAIKQVRALRAGSIETRDRVEAVTVYADCLHSGGIGRATD